MGEREIRELTSEDGFVAAFPVLQQLYSDFTKKDYLDLLPKVRKQGYRQFAFLEGGEIVTVAGIKQGTSFSSGDYVYIDDLVTDADHRYQGYGAKMLGYIHQWAREQNSDTVRLVTAMSRTGAHQFFDEKMDYERRGYYFRRDISGEMSEW